MLLTLGTLCLNQKRYKDPRFLVRSQDQGYHQVVKGPMSPREYNKGRKGLVVDNNVVVVTVVGFKAFMHFH
jgi:hypothetical protein